MGKVLQHLMTHSFHDRSSLLHICENVLARMKHVKCVRDYVANIGQAVKQPPC